MNEQNRFDEVTRALAMPIPRRKAFRYAASGLASAALAFLFPKRASAAQACQDVSDCLSGGTCKNDALCNNKAPGNQCGNRKKCMVLCRSESDSDAVCCKCSA
jgi:hypothetical protein